MAKLQRPSAALRYKKSETIDVKKHAPYLMGDKDHVHLGTFETGKLLGFDDVKEFLSRIIKYAEIRDKFRMEYKTARKNGTSLRL
jgi:hypothetical protein